MSFLDVFFTTFLKNSALEWQSGSLEFHNCIFFLGPEAPPPTSIGWAISFQVVNTCALFALLARPFRHLTTSLKSMLQSLDTGINMFFCTVNSHFGLDFMYFFDTASSSDFSVSEDAGIEHKRRHPILKMDNRYSLTLHESFNCLQITYRRTGIKTSSTCIFLTSVEGAYVDGSYMLAA